jgi:L-alanine-DL-glutamate epimerase-like enolase superfamily enzyme
MRADACTIPTDSPEGDGTFDWDSTTIIIVRAEAGGKTGTGYSYADKAAAALVNGALAPCLGDADIFDIPRCLRLMQRAVRNSGLSGIAACAIAAIDTALWDLKARLLGVSLAALFGGAAPAVPVYGSGGFTTYDPGRIGEQIAGWRACGISMAKIKIGARPETDDDRVKAARAALGDTGALFVDANGAYSVKQALRLAGQLNEYGVSWFEEPVSSDDLAGLRLLRRRAPAGMEIAAGEYGFTLFEHRRMLEAEAVDVLQIDATRCQGYSGFMAAAALARAANLPVSSHCAPALHLPVCAAQPHMRHMEYFHDHVRIEKMLFDGIPEIRDGCLAPDLARPGNGLEFRAQDAGRYTA